MSALENVVIITGTKIITKGTPISKGAAEEKK
jgi:hypothetical protein